MKKTLDELIDKGYEEETTGFYIILKKKRWRIIYDFKQDRVVDRYLKLRR